MEETKSCPCVYLEEPCHPRCTCVNKYSSYGCRYCCTYGSLEQRHEMASELQKKYDDSFLDIKLVDFFNELDEEAEKYYNYAAMNDNQQESRVELQVFSILKKIKMKLKSILNNGK